MNISHELKSDALVFSLVGELDHHAAHDVITYIARQAAMNRTKPIELDLTDLTFMDSSGLAVAVNAKRTAARNNCALVIRNTPPQAMKIFHAAHLEKMISFV